MSMAHVDISVLENNVSLVPTLFETAAYFQLAPCHFCKSKVNVKWCIYIALFPYEYAQRRFTTIKGV